MSFKIDYSTILEELQQASLFELYRLQAIISQRLDDQELLDELKMHLKVGQIIQYFNQRENRLAQAEILEVKRTRLLVKDHTDQSNWVIPIAGVNLSQPSIDLTMSTKKGLDRSQLSVGDLVGFLDKDNKPLYGKIIRLNPKTATIDVGDMEWRVAYMWLYRVIEGQVSGKNTSSIVIIQQ